MCHDYVCRSDGHGLSVLRSSLALVSSLLHDAFPLYTYLS